MNVFVAGPTGVLGRRAVALMIRGGHSVTAAVRDGNRTRAAEALGADCLVLDLFDPEAVKKAVAGHDAVCNLATRIPRASRSALPRAWAENDRLRSDAASNLAEGAIEHGARFIQESISFVYADGGDRWLDEESPVDAPGILASALVAEGHAERVTARGGLGVSLRFASFYGPDSHTTEAMLALARLRIGSGFDPNSYVSSIETDDAASAVVAALTVDAGTYNVADDEPVTRRAFADALSDALGVGRARIPPAALGRLGGSRTATLNRSQRVSNRRFKDASGWAPATASVSSGWPSVLARMRSTEEDVK